MKRAPSRAGGMTAVELVVIVAIPLVLFALLIPALVSMRGSDRHNDCRNSLKQIGIYIALYESKFGSYPPIGTGAGTWFSSLWRADMATDGNLFRCSHVGKAGTGTHYWGLVRGGSWVSSRSGCTGRPFTFKSAADLAKAPGDLPAACDQLLSPGNHGPEGDVNVLFLDGRVQNFQKDWFFLRMPPGFLGATGWDAPAGQK